MHVMLLFSLAPPISLFWTLHRAAIVLSVHSCSVTGLIGSVLLLFFFFFTKLSAAYKNSIQDPTIVLTEQLLYYFW